MGARSVSRAGDSNRGKMGANGTTIIFFKKTRRPSWPSSPSANPLPLYSHGL